MNRNIQFFTVLAIVVTALSSFQSKLISDFHLQMEITEEASEYVEGLENNPETNLLHNIPDSLLLNTTCVLNYKKSDSLTVHFKIGTVDGYGDIFEGNYNFLKTDEQNEIGHHVSGSSHYFKLGKLSNLNSFTAITWITNYQGEILDMAKYSK